MANMTLEDVHVSLVEQQHILMSNVTQLLLDITEHSVALSSILMLANKDKCVDNLRDVIEDWYQQTFDVLTEISSIVRDVNVDMPNVAKGTE